MLFLVVFSYLNFESFLIFVEVVFLVFRVYFFFLIGEVFLEFMLVIYDVFEIWFEIRVRWFLFFWDWFFIGWEEKFEKFDIVLGRECVVID